MQIVQANKLKLTLSLNWPIRSSFNVVVFTQVTMEFEAIGRVTTVSITKIPTPKGIVTTN